MEKQLEELIKRVEQLEQRRIYQSDISNDAIKMRHIGESVRYIRSGVAASRPTSGEEPLQGSAIYFSTDTNILSVWDGDEWVEFARIPAAPAVYAASNVTVDRTYDADTVVVAELADIVGTLIADLRSIGLVD